MEDNSNDDSFTVDTLPSDSYCLDSPAYGVSRKSTELIKLEEKTAQQVRPTQANSNPCWNCGKPFHSVRDCNVETNTITTEWNRELHLLMRETQGFNRSSGRYHQSESKNKYSNVVPGAISSQLRKVMGLSENDLPSFVYKLRKHGYPKAWLRHASVKPSGLNLYDAHGKEVADPDAEDGEILEEEDKIRYDLGKLIKFPGFNAPMPVDAVDDHERMNTPAFNEAQSLELMIEDLQAKAVSEYRLKKEKAQANISKENGTSDELPKDQNEDISSSQNPSDVCDSVETATSTQQTADTGYPSQEANRSMEDTSATAVVDGSSEDSLGRILTVSVGTPILKSRSGHSRLPPVENFSKDICDVINFENLPESTGKFERMRNLLKKVKKALGLQRESL